MSGKAVIVLVASLSIILVLGLIAASCGNSSTTTTAAPTTTAGPTTTAPATTSSSEASTTTTTEPFPIDAAALYAANCKGCHGNLPDVSAATAKIVIQNGRESMPSFSSKLSAAQITALANYVAAGGK